MNIKLASSILLFVVASGSAFASDLTGNWNGKMEIGKITFPSSVTPEQKKQYETIIESQKTALKKAVIKFTLKKDGTYTATTSGMPGAKDQTPQTGTWKSKGSDVTFTSKTGGKPMTGKLASGGKKIVFDVKGQGGSVTITLSR